MFILFTHVNHNLFPTMSSSTPKPKSKKAVAQVVSLEQDEDGGPVECVITTKNDKRPFLAVHRGILKAKLKNSDRPPTIVVKGQIYPMPLKYSFHIMGDVHISYPGQRTIGRMLTVKTSPPSLVKEDIA